MQKLFAAVSVMLFVVFASLSAFAQTAPLSEADRKAELNAAWQAASNAGSGGPRDIALIDQATLKLPAGYFFVPKAEGARVLRALGNVVNDSNFVGIVVGQHQNDRWIVVIRYIKEGYIKDDDAKNWNADDLLKNISDGVEEANKDRAARGFPEMQVIGWVEPPGYDAITHRLVWSLLSKDKDQPDNTPKNINYNTYALGRNGYFSLNLLTNSAEVEADKPIVHALLASLDYMPGKRYQDFDRSTDKVAAYGLAALIGVVAVKKIGLLAGLGIFLIKIWKVGLLALAGVGAAVKRFFKIGRAHV